VVSENPEVEAIETVGGVITDLVEVAERLPVKPDQAEKIARILDRLSQEIAEAAAMVREPASPDLAGQGDGAVLSPPSQHSGRGTREPTPDDQLRPATRCDPGEGNRT
jgi:hypothetical protein